MLVEDLEEPDGPVRAAGLEDVDNFKAGGSLVGRSEGKFVVIEGLDGAGSTTQARLLKEWFESEGMPTLLTSEPSDGPIGELIRRTLRGELGGLLSKDEATLALAFAADRLDHLNKEVLPALAKGRIVVCDRYYLSSYAYQSTGADLQWLKAINAKALRPDITIFMDVPPAVCLERIKKQGRHLELYEELPKLEEVKTRYLKTIQDLRQDGERIETVDGNRPVEQVFEDVVRQATAVVRHTS